MTYSKNDLKKNLKNLGLNKGDICLVRSHLREIGNIEGRRSKTVLDALLETIGQEGTLFALTFTKIHKLPLDKNNPEHYFTNQTKPYTGGFPRECLSHPDSLRSKHPATSFCGIGKDAFEILSNHNEKSSSYEPVGKMIEKNGKMLLIGALNENPGFISVHWAKWLLGYSVQSKYAGISGAYYFDEKGMKHIYIRNDIGGCSRGFNKFYKYYRDAKILTEGKLGDADCMMIELKKALKVELPLLKNNPRFFLCNNPDCRGCRIGWEFSDTNPIIFKIRREIPKLLQKIKQ